ncbi:PilW family protein [Spongiibacter marinus]|uniref:PilW family protein n=1 Tax=Spongiibacter marinus TaxID=354246 RepID=UPI00356233B3
MMRMPKHQQGLGLVELMISITLGLLLSAAIIQAFVATRSSYRVQEAISQIQVASRYANHFLGKDLRMAGYMGCASRGIEPNIVASNPDADVQFDETTAVRGFDNLAQNNAFDAVAGTDAITIRMASNISAQLTGNMTSDNANVQVSANTLGFIKDDYIMITDCEASDLFRATTVSESSGKVTIAHANTNNTTNRLSKAYGPDAEILAFESVSYFIRDTGRTTSDGNPIHGLFVQRRTAAQGGTIPDPAELVDGVENMQLTYGEDTDGDNNVDVYRDAANVASWGNVLSIRVELLVVSQEENVVGQTGSATAQRVQFAGQDVVNTDGRYRRSIVSVFAVRNRVQ